MVKPLPTTAFTLPVRIRKTRLAGVTVIRNLVRVVDVLSFVNMHFRTLAQHVNLAEWAHPSKEHVFKKMVSEEAVHHLLQLGLPSVGPASRRDRSGLSISLVSIEILCCGSLRYYCSL